MIVRPLNCVAGGLVFALALLAATLPAGEPAIRNVNIRGLQIGGTTTLVIDGDDFGTAPKLMLPFAAKQELKPGATDKQATFDVTPEGDITPGYHHLRVITEQGVSLPIVIAVDRLPQRAMAPAIDALPIALHGNLGGSSVLETKFTGKANQSVMVEVESQRLGGKLRPVLHLYDAKRRQLAWSWATPLLFGDARLEAVLPADGEYTVALHDLEYGAPQPGIFRLRIGQWSSVDQVFPARVALGQPASLELLGQAAAIKQDITATTAEIVPLAWPVEGLWSGARPHLETSSRIQILEQAVAGGVQELPVGSLDVHGRLGAPYEEDRYKVAVQSGQKLRLEVWAERLRSPLDTAIVVRNDKGDILARGEDSPDSLDALLEYTVPDQATAILIGVVDAQGRGGQRGIYRLAIDDSSNAGPPDFELVTPLQRITLSQGGRFLAPVHAARRGYDDAIELSALDLPAGLRLENPSIPAGCDGALVTVVRENVADGGSVIAWSGRSASGLQRTARLQNYFMERQQPWLASEVALATSTAKAADFTLDWRDLPADVGLLPAGKLPLPVKFTRPADPAFEKANVRLTLVTSQLPPLANNKQPDTNRMLRAEKPIELAPNVLEGDVLMLLPAELPSLSYDVSVQAELLGPDKRPLLTAFAPVRRLPMRNQLALQLTTPPRVEVPLDAKTGAMVKVEGKIERREGLTGDVMVAVTGLPPGARADAATVKADAVDFVLNIIVPPNARPGEWPPLKLSVSGVPDPAQANIRVRSREVSVVLVIQPPAAVASP